MVLPLHARMARMRRALIVAALIAAGCGGSEEPAQPEPTQGGAAPPGRELFVSTCGSCHTLSDAGTNGAVGPPLDGTTLDAAAITAKIDEGGGAMPPDLLSGADREMVARYVAEQGR